MSEAYNFRSFSDHLTDNARQSLENAGEIARTMGSSHVGTEHILLGVLRQNSSMGAKVLKDVGITFDRARTVLSLTPKVLTPTSARGLSELAKITLEISWNKARDYGQSFCGTEHIIFAILSQKNTRAIELLKDMNVEITNLKDDLEQLLSNQQYSVEGQPIKTAPKSKRKSKTPTLDYFGIDLTAKAARDRLDPVVGRANEIERMVTILNRRNKNNPVLIGEPGVGKTAIVEGLAQKIIEEKVPESLLDKRIVTLDLTSVIAGTKYRGEFEERLKRILDDIKSDENIIVFIDELHLIVGAGAAEGAIDSANILKPALARGLIKVIGATTVDEYRRHIEKDAALERRFQIIQVPEATLEETGQILRGLRGHYEEFHGVKIGDEIINETIKLSKRYLPERFFPDKALDLLDESAARLRTHKAPAPSKEFKDLQSELRNINTQMNDAVEDKDFLKANKLKDQSNQTEQKIEQLRKKSNKKKLTLSEEDLAHVVATITGVPLTKLVKREAKHLIRLEDALNKNVIGQKEATAAVAKAIRRSRSGISDARRPIGSFLFMGPTGVGKTELAKVLAKELFHSEDALIKIDMSEFMERHNVSRLMGAPAGYVGYDDGGQLTEKIRRQPYSLILFDEIEKAHPDVFNMLLQILEDGYATDAKGHKVDFSNTVIIMTSNIGAERLYKEAVLGFRAKKQSAKNKLEQFHEETKERVMDDLKKTMRPELLNRIDKIVVFKALAPGEVHSILKLRLNELSKRLIEKGIGLKVTTAAKNLLVDKGYEPSMGVRPLRRVIEEELEDPIATGILQEQFSEGDLLKVGTRNKKLYFEKEQE
ncbi:MAG: ATP-dependent Clp protease ATP-binding subunit [Candidatus Saccharimonadales bacterium]